MAIVRPFIAIPKTLTEWERFLRDATVGDDEITNEKLRDSIALSVIGRSANSPGNPGDIQAEADNQFLVRRSSVLGFGGIIDADIPDAIARVVTVEAVSVSQTLAAGILYLATGTITLTLPTLADKDVFYVKNIGSGLVTVSGLIDDKTAMNLKPYDAIALISDGTKAYIV